MAKQDEKLENTHAAEAREIEKQLQAMRDKANNLAANIHAMGRDELRALRARTAHFMADAREHGCGCLPGAEHMCENLADNIRRKPLAAVGAAVAAGFVLACLFRRR